MNTNAPTKPITEADVLAFFRAENEIHAKRFAGLLTEVNVGPRHSTADGFCVGGFMHGGEYYVGLGRTIAEAAADLLEKVPTPADILAQIEAESVALRLKADALRSAAATQPRTAA